MQCPPAVVMREIPPRTSRISVVVSVFKASLSHHSAKSIFDIHRFITHGGTQIIIYISGMQFGENVLLEYFGTDILSLDPLSICLLQDLWWHT